MNNAKYLIDKDRAKYQHAPHTGCYTEADRKHMLQRQADWDDGADWRDKYPDPQKEDMTGMLTEASIQLKYLSEKFGETGTGNNVISRIDALLQSLENK